MIRSQARNRRSGAHSIRPCRRRLAGLALLLMAATAWPQIVPEASQVPILFKLLTYDRTLWESAPAELRIGLLHRVGNEESRRNLNAMMSALDASSGKTINGVAFAYVTVSWSDADDLRQQLDTADIQVLYVTAGHDADLAQVAEQAHARGLLTLAGGEHGVGRGLAVGLDLDGGHPRIEVDLAALAAAGHQLDARVLRLCKVVQR